MTMGTCRLPPARIFRELFGGVDRIGGVLQEFVERYSGRAYQFAYGLCGNAEEASELVQEAFYRVIRSWDRYDTSRPLEAWFHAILRNVYYDGLKRGGRSRPLSLDTPLPGENEDGLSLSDCVADASDAPALAALERGEATQAVQKAMAGLAPEYRAILMLCDMQGLSYGEICSALGLPLNTVRTRLWRARAALRARLMRTARGVVEGYALP